MRDRALFESIDLTFELEVFGKNLLGAEVAVQYILDATDEFRTRSLREPRPAGLEICTLLVDEEKYHQSKASLLLACGLLEKMAQSFYIFLIATSACSAGSHVV